MLILRFKYYLGGTSWAPTATASRKPHHQISKLNSDSEIKILVQYYFHWIIELGFLLKFCFEINQIRWNYEIFNKIGYRLLGQKRFLRKIREEKMFDSRNNEIGWVKKLFCFHRFFGIRFFSRTVREPGRWAQCVISRSIDSWFFFSLAMFLEMYHKQFETVLRP